MPSTLYNSVKSAWMKKQHDHAASGDTFKVMLLDNSYSFDADAHTQYSDLSGSEVSGTGYTAGGQDLINQSVTDDAANDRAVWDADNSVWPNSTITAHYAAIYNDTHASKLVVGYIDFGGAQSSVAGNFSIMWHADGILHLT